MALPPNMSSFNRASPELLAQAAPEMGEGELVPKQEFPKGFDFKSLQEKVRNLASTGSNLLAKAQKSRGLRDMQVNNEEERRRGNFKQDEIYIPYKVIADNISKEAPSYIKFIIGSKNAAIFKPRNSPAVVNFEPLERYFTTAVRYEGYEQEIFGLIDGFQLHGIDYVEVLYDEDKPGMWSFEHLGYENVWYPDKVQRGKFQFAPIIVRNCELTREEIEKFPGVDMQQVELLFRDKTDNDPNKCYATVQKVYYRMNEIVHICWMDYKISTNFLRAPQPLFLGRKKVLIDEFSGMEISSTDIYEKFYPIVPFPYAIRENRNLLETLGRASLDENTQEAVSSMVSSMVNGYHRASQVLWAPKNPTSSAAITALDVNIEGGRGLSQPIDFFTMPYPDSDGMQIVNALMTQNKAETAQINFAVGNRTDYASRKTAKEIGVAEQTKTELDTTQVVLFSAAWREVMNIGWLITKSQVELGVLKPENVDPLMFSEDVILLAAGETEVLQRQETLVNLQNIWPVVANTPAAQPVLEDILRLMVPSNADKYIASMQAGDPRMLAQALAQIIAAIAQEHPNVIPPESYEQLAMLMDQVKQMSQSMSQPGGDGGPQKEQGNAPNKPPVIPAATNQQPAEIGA